MIPSALLLTGLAQAGPFIGPMPPPLPPPPRLMANANVVGARVQQVTANVLGWSAVGTGVISMFVSAVAAQGGVSRDATASAWLLTGLLGGSSSLLFATGRGTVRRLGGAPPPGLRTRGIVASSLQIGGMVGVASSMVMLDRSGDDFGLGFGGFTVLALSSGMYVIGLLMNSKNLGRILDEQRNTDEQWGTEQMGLMVSPLVLPEGGGLVATLVF